MVEQAPKRRHDRKPDYARYYDGVARECRQAGLVAAEVARSARGLVERSGRGYVLKDIAFKPTGVALGRPLPNASVARLLWGLVQQLEGLMKILHPRTQRIFGYVPPEWYHVTVVNWTHFERHRRVHNLSSEAQKRAKQVVSEFGAHPLSIRFAGLVLTRGGRLLVPGYPRDRRLHRIRRRLVECVPEFAEHVPPAAHIKLGHLLVRLPKSELTFLLDFLSLCSGILDRCVVFHNLYTPVGRIRFRP